MTDREWAEGVLGFQPGTSELVDRLEAIQKHVGGQERMSGLTGLSVSGVKAWRSRGSEPGLLAMNRLSKGSGISLEYMATGEIRTVQDVMIEEIRLERAKSAFPVPSSEARRAARLRAIQKAARSLATIKAEIGRVPPEEEIAADFAPVPRYEVSASAGGGALVVTEAVTEQVPFRRDWLHDLGVSIQHAALMESSGDSMFPTIPDRALMLIDRNPDQPIRSGFLYAIIFNGELLVKRLSRNIDGTFDLISDNPLYPKQTVSQVDLDRLNIAGRVAWVAHKI